MAHPRALLLPALALLLVVAGCGGPRLPPGAPPPTPADDAALVASKATGVPCRPVLTEPGEVAYWGLGVRTYPAPAGTPTRLTAAEALADPDVRDWAGSAQEAELRLVSTGDFGCESHPTGVVRQAAWVVTIHDTTPARRGPPGQPALDPALRCTSVVIVDARTGALLSNFQSCGEDPAVRSPVPG